MSSDSSSLSAQVNRLGMGADQEHETAPAELVASVEDLLNQLGPKFSSLSSEMIAKMDEMSRRLDNLEATIQAGNTAAESEADK
ncbi:hypothetical protein AMS68_000819 [Peltaster fructicola]|uniref:Heat shock factor binding protein 1 n=1 Tax=Peltaster fructicola TaxID=286661 RepID=A0A6H0XKN8_9PEZI|nr:hypothetical protein AMS68_000819 [Peltaster fructicola]